jgi:hypothetical protein
LSLEVVKIKRARKVLTEFELKNEKKLRIFVHIWGDRKYAENLGYHGNIVYKPVLVDKKGTVKRIYLGRKGLPTMKEIKNLYSVWVSELADEGDKERLRDLVLTLYELAQTKIYFDSREAHIVYQLLRIARQNPLFDINKEEDVEDLNVEIMPIIEVSFKGIFQNCLTVTRQLCLSLPKGLHTSIQTTKKLLDLGNNTTLLRHRSKRDFDCVSVMSVQPWNGRRSI